MWFTDTPWPPILICSVLGVLLVAAWYPNRRGIYLLGVVGLIFLSGAIYAVEQHIVTEAERIEKSVLDVTRAFERADLEKTLSFFARTDTQDRKDVTAAMLLVEVEEDLRITDLQVKMMENNSRAVSHFRANATIRVLGQVHRGRHPSRWELTWQKEAEDWKIVSVRRLNIVTGEEMRTLAQVE